MALPSKKQLHKHKRGTRKALDTLEAMENGGDLQPMVPDDEDVIIERKKSPKEDSQQSEVEKEAEKDKKPVDLELNNNESDSDEKDQIESKNEEENGLAPESEISEEADSKQSEIELDPQTGESVQHPVDPALSEDAIPEEKNVKPSKSSGEISEKTVDSLPNQKENEEAVQEDKNTPDLGSDNKEAPGEKESSAGREYQDFEETTDHNEDTQKDKYLSFRIGDEVYGISIQYVTEIIVIQRITEVPDTPAFVKGVINLRGKVIPVIDIRMRFGMTARDYDERTCIIVVEHEETSVGLIVDTVNEVVDIPEENVDPPPQSHSGIESTYIEGMGKTGAKVTILLDIERVLFASEILAKRKDLEE